MDSPFSGNLLTGAGRPKRLMSFAEVATYSLSSARLAICRLRRLVDTSRQPWVYFIAETGQKLLQKFSVAESGKYRLLTTTIRPEAALNFIRLHEVVSVTSSRFESSEPALDLTASTDRQSTTHLI